jgi:hypothetical protein
MSYNDPTIGAILYMAKQLTKKASWRVVAASKSTEDEANAAFLRECQNDMSITWSNFIAEALSMMVYGWSWHEIVFKIRDGKKSKYSDRKIGWAKIVGRSQETLNNWNFDDATGNIVSMTQAIPSTGQFATIPLAKSLLFRTDTERDNPEGKSLLRNAYRPWYFKKHIEEIEGIGIERDLAGLPVITPPEDLDIWDKDDPESVALLSMATSIVKNIRRDQNEGLVLPFGWTLQLLSTGSKRQFDTNAILNRYDQRIAITMLSDIVMLGADKVGSFALADVKKSLLATSLETLLDDIGAIINTYAVPQLMQLNGIKSTAYPRFEHDEVETPNLNELGAYIKDISGAQMPLFPDIDLENYLRKVASMPLVDKDRKLDEPIKTKEEGVINASE